MPLHPWEPLKLLGKLPKAAVVRAAALAACHKPVWSDAGWACSKCGCRFRSAERAAASTGQACTKAFGAAFHGTHAISTGIARSSPWHKGVAIAICRGCACYTLHKSVGLSRPCRHNTSGRRARLTRFLAGRHPEPGFSGWHVDGIVHHPRLQRGPPARQLASVSAASSRSSIEPRPSKRPRLESPCTVAPHALLPRISASRPSGGEEDKVGDLQGDPHGSGDPVFLAFDAVKDDSDDEFGLDVEVGLD